MTTSEYSRDDYLMDNSAEYVRTFLLAFMSDQAAATGPAGGAQYARDAFRLGGAPTDAAIRTVGHGPAALLSGVNVAIENLEQSGANPAVVEYLRALILILGTGAVDFALESGAIRSLIAGVSAPAA